MGEKVKCLPLPASTTASTTITKKTQKNNHFPKDAGQLWRQNTAGHNIWQHTTAAADKTNATRRRMDSRRCYLTYAQWTPLNLFSTFLHKDQYLCVAVCICLSVCATFEFYLRICLPFVIFIYAFLIVTFAFYSSIHSLCLSSFHRWTIPWL